MLQDVICVRPQSSKQGKYCSGVGPMLNTSRSCRLRCLCLSPQIPNRSPSARLPLPIILLHHREMEMRQHPSASLLYFQRRPRHPCRDSPGFSGTQPMGTWTIPWRGLRVLRTLMTITTMCITTSYRTLMLVWLSREMMRSICRL